MKEASPGQLGNVRMLSAFFALTMLLILVVSTRGTSAQARQGFALAGNLVSARCSDNQLSVRHVTEDAAMGGVRTIDYAFTNTSSSPCTLSGYPRFEVLSRSGRLARHGRASRGLNMLDEEAKKGPHPVTIEPGKTAMFQVYYNAGGAGYMGKPCPIYRKVRITAPGARRGFVLREEIQLCGRLEVSPVGWPRAE
ncbi:MAG: hypothetical protein QOH25_139 [Acidobacteriota bacterium]|jgi:hypothetical protein|nr:hypothetical protein [Acidobacteriota bacterium]